MVRTLAAVILLGIFALPAACALADKDDILDGKTCDSAGRCAAGFSCDTAHNVCRKAAPPASASDAAAGGAPASN